MKIQDLLNTEIGSLLRGEPSVAPGSFRWRTWLPLRRAWRGPRYLRTVGKFDDLLCVLSHLAAISKTNAALGAGLRMSAEEELQFSPLGRVTLRERARKPLFWLILVFISIPSLLVVVSSYLAFIYRVSVLESLPIEVVVVGCVVLCVLLLTALVGLRPGSRRGMRRRRILTHIAGRLESGVDLSDVMREMTRLFPLHHGAMARAAERAGTLDSCLAALADEVRGELERRSTTRIGLLYLGFLAVVEMHIAVFILIKVLPVLLEILDEFSASPPQSTLLLIGIGDFVIYRWADVLTAAGVSIIVFYLLRAFVPPFRLLFSRVGLRMPLLGSARRYTAAARVSQVFARLDSAGLPVQEAIAYAESATDCAAFQSDLRRWSRRASLGASLSECANGGEKLGAMPSSFGALTSIGERAGRLPATLQHLASVYAADARRARSVQAGVLQTSLMLLLAVCSYIVIRGLYEGFISVTEALLNVL